MAPVRRRSFSSRHMHRSPTGATAVRGRYTASRAAHGVTRSCWCISTATASTRPSRPLRGCPYRAGRRPRPVGRSRARRHAVLARGRSLKAALVVGRVCGARPAHRADLPAGVVQVETGALGDALAAPRRATQGRHDLRPCRLPPRGLPLRGERSAARPSPRRGRGPARGAARPARADAAVVFTERDRWRSNTRVASTELVTIPLGWDVPATALDPVGRSRRRCCSSATSSTRRTSRPRSRSPSGSCRSCGRRIPRRASSSSAARRRRRSRAGRRRDVVTGDVPSVTPYLDRAAIVVAPIATGGGMRVKLLEALAAGKAVVANVARRRRPLARSPARTRGCRRRRADRGGDLRAARRRRRPPADGRAGAGLGGAGAELDGRRRPLRGALRAPR